MDLLTALDRASAAAARIVSAITVQQLDAPTPCEKWSVREVINHLIDGNRKVESLLVGRETSWTGRGPGERPPEHFTKAPDAFGSSLRDLRSAITTAPREATFQTPFGKQPAAMLAHMRINELLVHSWDLAVATGQPTDYEPELAEGALRMWRARLGGGPRPGAPFDVEQPVPAGASTLDRLAAFLGRKVPTQQN
ncbi:TIGR03086 family protein [Pseudonocardiaceae bacterium YIM PH 21723]|nr:TIGR03086 family protein [Pseudonocardiaceae bacterium YIM PH 21723]